MSMPTTRSARGTQRERSGALDTTADVVGRIGTAVRDRLDASTGLDPVVVERAVIRTLDQLATNARVREVLQSAVTSTPPAVLSAIAEQELRWRDIESRHGLLDSAQVADLTGSAARNRAGTASHLRTTGKALAVFRGGRYLFPGFQFTADGRVHPVVSKVIAVMAGEGWRPESIVEWLDSPNGYLGGRTPIERITDEAAVLNAATNAAHAGR